VQNQPRTRRRPFWRLLRDPAVSGDALPRTLLLDVPYAGFEPDDDGCVHVFGWGQRGAQMNVSSPPSVLPEIEAKHGRYPQIFNREAANRPLVSRSQLRALERLTAKRADVLIDLMNAHPWDLCSTVFFEPHLAGHAFHVPHDPDAYRAIGASTRFTRGLEDALTRCYKAADTALGRVIEAAPAGTTVAVHAGIGLRPNTNGIGILPKVLDALGYRSPLPIRTRTRAREAALRTALAVVPRPVLRRAKALVGNRAAYDHMVQVWTESVDWSSTRAWAEGEPGWGYVRLNVRGREPQGTVDPDDYRALCDEIAAELVKLENVATGEPAIEAVLHRDDLIGPHDDSPLPDLIVRWARTHLIRAVRHPVAGVIEDEMKDFRVTEHNDDGWLVLAGPSVRAGTDIGEARLEDVAPTIIHLMGGAVPDDIEGSVLTDMLAPGGPPVRTCAAAVSDTPLTLA
jgi:predicted AlkP superfamily phosphohydrolase/phosphomutase